ncbi:MAG: hypothetical protein MZW92_40210 [Comamonadaceae bacterium]|nr:hypothetical protein [Comamonadaceae bacterium]
MSAKTLRWASQGDILTFDPHVAERGPEQHGQLGLHLRAACVRYNEKFELEPALAVSWTP